MLLPDHAHQLSQLILKHHLGPVESTIVRGSQSCIELLIAEPEDYSTLGNTRFGGDPDLPQQCEWKSRLTDLVFILQVNLEALPQGPALGLPTKGLLYVFSDTEGDETRTFFEPDTTSLARHVMEATAADNPISPLRGLKLIPHLGIDLPQPGSDEDYLIDEAGLTSEFKQFSRELTTGRVPACQIVGRPGELNGDSRKEAVKKFGGKAADYRVLWKLFSNDDTGLIIGDYHQLHGLISYQDLSSHDFSKVVTYFE